jgi:hypothetical protein
VGKDKGIAPGIVDVANLLAEGQPHTLRVNMTFGQKMFVGQHSQGVALGNDG